MALKEEREVLTEIDVKNQYEDLLDFTTGEKSFCCSQTEKSSTRKTAQKEREKSYFTCFKVWTVQTSSPFENRKEEFHLPTMWNKIHSKRKLENRQHENSHGRKSLTPANDVARVLLYIETLSPCKNSHWREPLHMSSVWKAFR